MSTLEERLSAVDGERKSLQTQLSNVHLDLEKLTTELQVWQTRHRELLEQQTQFGPDVVNELRSVAIFMSSIAVGQQKVQYAGCTNKKCNVLIAVVSLIFIGSN